MNRFGKKYLITGASGLFGGMACVELSKSNEVHGIYHQHKVLLPRTKTYGLDLNDFAAFSYLLQQVKPDVLIHAAALIDVEFCEANSKECHRFNHDVVRELVKICVANSVKFVLLSTDAFFELPEGRRAKEEMEPNVVTAYGSSKRAAEKSVLEMAPDSLVVRTNIYGWNKLEKQSLAEWMLDGLLTGKTLTLFRDVIYCPILVNTLARAIDALVQVGERGIFHVVSREALTKFDFGMRVAKEFGLDQSCIIPISVAEKRFRARRSRNMALDTGKFERRIPGLLRDVDTDLREFRELLRTGIVDQLKGFKHLPELRR